MKTFTLFLMASVLPMDASPTQIGVASWYGKENSRSCSGKRLHHNVPAAAHKHLPLGSWVKVTSTRSRKSVVVLIEDRGPYKKNRIIDLNLPAAKQLGITKKGIDHVSLEVLR
jgi:rare lipoprotein A